MRQVAGVVVSGGGGRIQSEGRQGGHAEVLGSVVGTKTAQVILGDGAGRHHMVDRPLQAGEAGRWSPSHPVPPKEMSPHPRMLGGTRPHRGRPRPARPPPPHPAPSIVAGLT